MVVLFPRDYFNPHPGASVPPGPPSFLQPCSSFHPRNLLPRNSSEPKRHHPPHLSQLGSLTPHRMGGLDSFQPSEFGRLGNPGSRSPLTCVCPGLPPQLADGRLLMASSQGRGESSSQGLFLGGPWSPSRGLCSHALITSQRYLLIPPLGG